MILEDRSTPTMADAIVEMLSDDSISQSARVDALVMAAHGALDGLHKLSLIGALTSRLVNKSEFTPDIRAFIKQIDAGH
jgi:hypothetical protein